MINDEGTFKFNDGKVVRYKLTVNERKLAQMIWQAAHNKNGKAQRGAFTIEAKEEKQ